MTYLKGFQLSDNTDVNIVEHNIPWLHLIDKFEKCKAMSPSALDQELLPEIVDSGFQQAWGSLDILGSALDGFYEFQHTVSFQS